MDAFARGLRNAAKVVEEGVLNTHLKVYRCVLDDDRMLYWFSWKRSLIIYILLDIYILF